MTRYHSAPSERTRVSRPLERQIDAEFRLADAFRHGAQSLAARIGLRRQVALRKGGAIGEDVLLRQRGRDEGEKDKCEEFKRRT